MCNYHHCDIFRASGNTDNSGNFGHYHRDITCSYRFICTNTVVLLGTVYFCVLQVTSIADATCCCCHTDPLIN